MPSPAPPTADSVAASADALPRPVDSTAMHLRWDPANDEHHPESRRSSNSAGRNERHETNGVMGHDSTADPTTTSWPLSIRPPPPFSATTTVRPPSPTTICNSNLTESNTNNSTSTIAHDGSPPSVRSRTRVQTFTEAVPLSLSSMAHVAQWPRNVDRDGNHVNQTHPKNHPAGVVEGLRQVVAHALSQCVNYARHVHPPHQWTLADVVTSPHAWTAVPEATTSTIRTGHPIPRALAKAGFQHYYRRNAWIYLSPVLPPDLSLDQDLDRMSGPAGPSSWTTHVGVLGCISLLYTSMEQLTAGELDASDREEMPPTILYKAVVEYRSLPPTGNPHSVAAEELSMLSFGGSVDDNVKYGALAGLYDKTAKYVLDIYSVRGKKYRFDSMDSTLSDGSVPQLPLGNLGNQMPDNLASQHDDNCSPHNLLDEPSFVKCLCVTVTDHQMDALPPPSTSSATPIDNDDPSATQSSHVRLSHLNQRRMARLFSVTHMHFSLEGKLRQPCDMAFLPDFDEVVDGLRASFLSLDPDAPRQVTAQPSGHHLILDPAYTGRIYVNGQYVTTWGRDPRVGSHGVALFGFNLHSVPMWHGRIVNYETMKTLYAQLWMDLLVDGRLLELNLANRLLHRLLSGHDPDVDMKDEYAPAEAHTDCLESQVLSSQRYDRVGIAAKALATRFLLTFGRDAFPCLSHEVSWTRRELPLVRPVVVPYRLLLVLKRGGLFDVQVTSDDFWYQLSSPTTLSVSMDLLSATVRLLQAAGCPDVSTQHLRFVRSSIASDAVAQKSVCRYRASTHTFYIHESFLSATERLIDDLPPQIAATETMENHQKPPDDDGAGAAQRMRLQAYILGMYVAQEHSDGTLLARYLLKNRPFCT